VTPGPDDATGDRPGDRERHRVIIEALRSYGTESTRLAQIFAALHHLQAADLHALVAIMTADRAGAPLTPRVLRGHLGLSSGGTSYVIDRLERAGQVRRSREDTRDNRVVHLRSTEQGMVTAGSFFGPLGALTEAVLDTFDAAELRVIERFITAAADTVTTHLNHLARDGDLGTGTGTGTGTGDQETSPESIR